MYSLAQQQQQQNYSFQRFESDRTVEETKPVRVVHAQFNSPINLYSQEKIAESLNQVLKQDSSYQTVASGTSPNISQQRNTPKDKYVNTDPWRKAPLPPPKPKAGVQFQPQSLESFSRQDSMSRSSVDSSNVQQSFENQNKFGASYRQVSQEVVEEYSSEDYSNQDFEYLPPPVTDTRVFGMKSSNQKVSQNVRDNRVFGDNSVPKRDTRVFAANYREPRTDNYNREQTTQRTDVGIQRQASNEFKIQSESEETILRSMTGAQSQSQRGTKNQQYHDSTQSYENQQRQEMDQTRRKNLEEQQRRYLELEQMRLEEERMSQGSPSQGEEVTRFTLHQGSVVQFPSKLHDPKYKLPDGSHLGEEKHMVRSHEGTVCQFATKIPDPNQKLIEGSHLGEERENIHLHGGSVCQFSNEVPDYSYKLPEAPHIKDLEDLEHLHLKQGSVVQFPKEIRETKMNGFKPPKEALEENLPTADSVKYNQLLPSEARRQQAYLVHPCHQPIKLLSEVYSAPGSPSMGRRGRHEWPPRSSSQERSCSPFIIPEGGKKSFVWPPPKPEFHRSLQELPPPDTGYGPAADVWHPQERTTPRSYRQPMISRKKPVWPPQSPRMVKQSSLPEPGSGRRIEFEEHFLYHAGCNIPVCYRPPPGTQFYNPYEE